ncbi:MAG: hypothetical protein U1F27_04520 [Turneriella sp.]
MQLGSDHSTPQGKGPTPQARAQNLIKEFVEFSEKFSAQIPLAIPKGTLKTIDYYRDTYFKYLKDSEFKSNICYMLQLIEYQLWQYKLFKPQYSLESALFFQLLVTQGIIIEAVVFALIADPLVVTDTSDRSKGTGNPEHANLLKIIRRRTFAAHIQQLRTMNILTAELCTELDTFRNDIRNLVHLQNWEGRLYRQLPLSDYNKHLQDFDRILKSLNAQIEQTHTLADLLTYYGLDGRRIRGSVKFLNQRSGKGQLDAKGVHDFIPFFADELAPGLHLRRGDAVSFTLAATEHGVRARDVERA